MKFGTIHYMEWHKTKPESGIDLCRSGITPRGLEDLDLQWSDLELSGSDFYGYLPLITAISQRFETGEEHIVSTLGASQGLFLLCAALLSPGDRVVIESPAYEPIVAVPEAFETEIFRFERRYEEERTVNLDQFESSIPDGTRMIVMTNLQNPTGVSVSDEDIEKLADIAASKGAWLCIDEVYREFMASESDRLSWVEPDAGVTCFPRLETGETGDDLAERLLLEHDTAITPGSFFGAPENVRIGFGGSSEYLSLGLEKISDALDSNQ